MYSLKGKSDNFDFELSFSEIAKVAEKQFGGTFILSGLDKDSNTIATELTKAKVYFDAFLEGNSAKATLTKCYLFARSSLPPFEYSLEVSLID